MIRYLARLLPVLALAVAVLAVVAPAVPAYADTDPFKGITCSKASDSAICKNSNGDPLTGPNGVLQKASTLIAIIGGAFAIIMMVLSGITYITANGDKEAIGKAKRTLIFSTVGLVILIMGRFIVGWVIIQV